MLVGISWRGGGRSDRIKQKSIDPDDFLQSWRDHQMLFLLVCNMETMLLSASNEVSWC